MRPNIHKQTGDIMRSEASQSWQHGSIAYSLHACGQVVERDDGRLFQEVWEQFQAAANGLPEALDHSNVTTLTPRGIASRNVFRKLQKDFGDLQIILRLTVKATTECDLLRTMILLHDVLDHMDGVIRKLYISGMKRC